MLKPLDAYCAGVNQDGIISGNIEIADPNSKIVVVVCYEFGDAEFHAIYHDHLDKWELFEDDHPGQKPVLIDESSPHYDHITATAETFSDKLLAGPCPDAITDRLTRKMTKEILKEIDNDILRDPRHYAGVKMVTVKPTATAHILSLVSDINSPRGLKASWTMDTHSLETAWRGKALQSSVDYRPPTATE